MNENEQRYPLESTSLFRIILVTITIFVQFHYSKPFCYCITDLMTCFTIFFYSPSLFTGIFFCLYECLQLIDLGSYIFTNHGFNNQIYIHLNPNSMKQYYWLFYVILILYIPFCFYIPRTKWHSTLPTSFFVFIFFLSSFFLYISLHQHLDIFNPFHEIDSSIPNILQKKALFTLRLNEKIDNDFKLSIPQRLHNLFTTIPSEWIRTKDGNITYFKTKKAINELKNLIMIDFESFEESGLGIFNPLCPTLSPFLSNFSQRGLFATNVKMLPYLHFTIAAEFAAQCGLPLLTSTTNLEYRQETIHMHDYNFCAMDHLKHLGYHMESHQSTYQGGGKWGSFFKKHGFKIYDIKNHKRDGDTFNYIKQNVFPKLVNSKKNNKRYVILIETANTHLRTNVHEIEYCKKRLPEGKCNEFLGFDCDDQIFEDFFKTFEDLHLNENTEVIIYGDHLNMARNFKSPNKKRRVMVFMPYQKHRIVKRESSLYDIGPTILDALGIDYQPHFPFGVSLLKDVNEMDINYPKTNNDFLEIYTALNYYKSVQFESIDCIGHTGFCNGNEDFSKQAIKDLKVVDSDDNDDDDNDESSNIVDDDLFGDIGDKELSEEKPKMLN